MLEQVNSRCHGLYMLYYNVKTRVITSHTIYLLIRIKPAGDPLLWSRYSLSRTQGVDRWVGREISTNTDLFILNFCTHIIYIYTSKIPQFQASQRCIWCLVASESGEH
jgi:hypothetical protein